MNETVLLKSGDLYFSPSAGGSDASLPLDRKMWLNEQIIKMCTEITDLQTSGGVPGKDGHNVILKAGLYPEDAPDLPENYAVLWRQEPRAGEVERPWQVLVRMKDLTGPVGPAGPEGEPGKDGAKGDPGSSVKIVGYVERPSDLVGQTSAQLGDGYIAKSTGELYVLVRTPPSVLSNWFNAGRIKGDKGDTGKTGKTGKPGPQGPKGESGGISSFIMQWIVDTATNQAISYVMMDINTAINDAINDMANQLMSMAENAATSAVEKAIDDMMDQLKGEKGEKGDKGDKGKDGTSFKLVGRFATVPLFMAQFPASEATVGCAAMIGREDATDLEMWAITQSSMIPGLPATYKYENFGKLEGPKGRDATWEVSVRDKNFVETRSITVESDLPAGVAGMYIQDSDSVVVEGLSGSQLDPKQVGFRMSMKYPIPQLIKEGDAIGTPTAGKVLGNDGEKLKWVEGGTGGSSAKEELLIKGDDGKVWSLTVDDTGRLAQELSIKTTDDMMLKIKSPNGQNWGIIINNQGRIQISEVL